MMYNLRKLGESQRAVLDYLHKNGSSTAEQVGKDLYVRDDCSNLCGRNTTYSYRSTTWARRILRDLVAKGLVDENQAHQFTAKPLDDIHEIRLTLGTYQDSIKIQLKEQGVCLSESDNERFQKLANSISMLQLHGFMPDKLCRVIRKRLIKQIIKHVVPIKQEV